LWVKIAIFQLKNTKNLTARSWFVKEKRFYFAKKTHIFYFPPKRQKRPEHRPMLL
jgi:hypothetical protein